MPMMLIATLLECDIMLLASFATLQSHTLVMSLFIVAAPFIVSVNCNLKLHLPLRLNTLPCPCVFKTCFLCTPFSPNLPSTLISVSLSMLLLLNTHMWTHACINQQYLKTTMIVWNWPINLINFCLRIKHIGVLNGSTFGMLSKTAVSWLQRSTQLLNWLLLSQNHCLAHGLNI